MVAVGVFIGVLLGYIAGVAHMEKLVKGDPAKYGMRRL